MSRLGKMDSPIEIHFILEANFIGNLKQHRGRSLHKFLIFVVKSDDSVPPSV